MDHAAPVSLARQFLADRDRPGNVADQRACEVVRGLLRHMDGAIERAAGPLLFDRCLVASMLRHPGRYRGDVVAMQAALVQGTLGQDSPMEDPPLAVSPRRHVDEE